MASCTTRAQFITRFAFELDPKYDFHVAGKRAEWAPGHPFTWESCHNSIQIPTDDSDPYPKYSIAMSSDDALLAVSSGQKVYIYDIESRELRQSLDGCSHVAFRPVDMRGEHVGQTEEEDMGELEAEMRGGPRYTLVCSIPETGTPCRSLYDSLILWDLDRNGHLLDEDEPVDTHALAAKAIANIAPALTSRHEWTPHFIATSTLTAGVEAALRKAETTHRISHNTKFHDACLISFGEFPFSTDGSRMLYATHNKSTQSSMRENDALPCVVGWDLDAGKEPCQMRGHTHAILWAGFSPDGTRVATVSWDRTIRMHDALTGTLHWASEASGGQGWGGAFSPDGKHIACSCASGLSVRVLDVASGSCCATFPIKLRSSATSLSWDPDGTCIAIGSSSPSAYVWRPFEGASTDAVMLELEVKRESEVPGFPFTDLPSMKWLDDAKLAVGCSDGSILVWDRYANAKEGFLRPESLVMEGIAESSIHFLKERDTYVCLDYDGAVRFWRLSAPAYPSR